MKKSTWVIGVIAIVALVFIFANRGPKEAAGEGIKVGFIAALSGVGSAIGNEELKGARLAVKEINRDGGVNGRPIELVAEDLSLDKLRQAGSVTQKLIDLDKVVAIVGPQWDEPALAIAPIIEGKQVPTVSQNITPIAEQNQSYEYLFSAWPSNEVGVRELLAFAKARGWTKIAIIQPGNFGFWDLVSNYFTKHAPSYGLTIVSREANTDLANADYRTLISKAKTAKPDAVFGTFAELECPFIRQMTDLGLNVPLISTESAGTPDALNNCPDILAGRLFFSTPAHFAGYADFASAFKKEYASEPEFPSAVTAYDAVRVLADALKRTDGGGGEELKQELERVDISGASLPRLVFDDRGYVVTPDNTFEIRTVLGGQFIKAE